MAKVYTEDCNMTFAAQYLTQKSINKFTNGNVCNLHILTEYELK